MVANFSENTGVDPRQEDKYLLQVSAGPSYQDAERHIVRVNGSEPCRIENEFMTALLRVQIRDYHGASIRHFTISIISTSSLSFILTQKAKQNQ